MVIKMKNQKHYLVGKLVLVLALSLMMVAFAGCQPQSENNAATTAQPESKSSDNGTESSAENIGNFKTVDLNDDEVTPDIFKENDLTLVNLFSTMCNPCMAELPDLAALSEELKDKKVGIVCIDMDVDMEGNPDEVSREEVKTLLKDAGSEMTVIFPDDVLIDNVVMKTDAIPYSFFVDKDGNIVGEDYTGSHTKEEWQEIIEEAIKNEK